MTNFDFLRSEKRFASFAGAAAAAEKIYPIDTAACAVNVRRAMELTVKWMYDTDKRLTEPKRTSLAALLDTPSFRATVDKELAAKLEFIRRVGNNAAHHPASVTKAQAALALRHLFDFANFAAKRYGAHTSPYPYDETLLCAEEEIVTEALDSERIAEIIRENRTLKRMLRAQTAEEPTDTESASSAPLNEAETRRLYIETDLAYAGWRIGIDCLCEYRIDNLAGGSGVGYADYVLFDGKVPLAVVEAQAAGDDPAIGRQQAKLYADALEKKHGTRPILFLTSGTDTRIWRDSCETERKVAGIFSKADLLRLKRLCEVRKNARLPETDLTDRPYQKEAVEAVLRIFCKEKKRTASLSMAPATGKTRVAIAIADALHKAGVVQNVLYLTESDLLVQQTLRECEEIPSLRCASLSSGKNIVRCDFLAATYEAVLADADDLYDGDGAHLFTPGHFDLILCDEADGRIMDKYRNIFETFDARTLFLTSTPAGEDAAFSYTYAQAIADGYIAPMRAYACRLDSLENGIAADRLDAAQRKDFDTSFRRVGLRPPQKIAAEDMLTKYYNEGTVRLMLETLCRKGVTKNSLPEKTIIFTESHFQSEMIYELFSALYPDAPPHFCRVIDLSTNYTDSLITDFAKANSLPEIALSHDLLFDGVDVPSVRNLVFFTKAASRSQFWRMLGRGMRLCEGKSDFFVLDLCGNFETYGNTPSDPRRIPKSDTESIFALRVRLAAELQSLQYANSCEQLRKDTVREITARLRTVKRDSFAARRHAQALDHYAKAAALTVLTEADVQKLCTDLAPLLPPDKDSPAVRALDRRMLTLMLARTQNRTDGEITQTLDSLREDALTLAKRASHKKITQQKKLLNRIIHNGYLENASLLELEEARRALRTIVRFLPTNDTPVRLNVPDRLLSLAPIELSENVTP
ncbi:MAG: DEAD/DEAH box helicase family protein [Clostridia bacterium]|nr:DEAD/DEAH box helicase family protein [Clostridia bacterium]